MIFNPIFLQEYLNPFQSKPNAGKFQSTNYLFANIINVYDNKLSGSLEKTLHSEIGNNLFTLSDKESIKISKEELIQFFETLPNELQIVESLPKQKDSQNSEHDLINKVISVKDILNIIDKNGKVELVTSNRLDQTIIISRNDDVKEEIINNFNVNILPQQIFSMNFEDKKRNELKSKDNGNIQISENIQSLLMKITSHLEEKQIKKNSESSGKKEFDNATSESDELLSMLKQISNEIKDESTQSNLITLLKVQSLLSEMTDEISQKVNLKDKTDSNIVNAESDKILLDVASQGSPKVFKNLITQTHSNSETVNSTSSTDKESKVLEFDLSGNEINYEKPIDAISNESAYKAQTESKTLVKTNTIKFKSGEADKSSISKPVYEEINAVSELNKSVEMDEKEKVEIKVSIPRNVIIDEKLVDVESIRILNKAQTESKTLGKTNTIKFKSDEADKSSISKSVYEEINAVSELNKSVEMDEKEKVEIKVSTPRNVIIDEKLVDVESIRIPNKAQTENKTLVKTNTIKFKSDEADKSSISKPVYEEINAVSELNKSVEMDEKEKVEIKVSTPRNVIIDEKLVDVESIGILNKAQTENKALGKTSDSKLSESNKTKYSQTIVTNSQSANELKSEPRILIEAIKPKIELIRELLNNVDIDEKESVLMTSYKKKTIADKIIEKDENTGFHYLNDATDYDKKNKVRISNNYFDRNNVYVKKNLIDSELKIKAKEYSIQIIIKASMDKNLEEVEKKPQQSESNKFEFNKNITTQNQVADLSAGSLLRKLSVNASSKSIDKISSTFNIKNVSEQNIDIKPAKYSFNIDNEPKEYIVETKQATKNAKVSIPQNINENQGIKIDSKEMISKEILANNKSDNSLLTNKNASRVSIESIAQFNQNQKQDIVTKNNIIEYKSSDEEVLSLNQTKKSNRDSEKFEKGNDNHQDVLSESKITKQNILQEKPLDFVRELKNNLSQITEDARNQSIDIVKTIKEYELKNEIKNLFNTNESRNVTLKLTPENLGRVNVNIEIHENMMNTKIGVDSESIKNIIQSTASELKNLLNQSGIELVSLTINMNNTDDKGNHKFISKNKKRINNIDEILSREESANEETSKKLGYNTYDYIM